MGSRNIPISNSVIRLLYTMKHNLQHTNPNNNFPILLPIHAQHLSLKSTSICAEVKVPATRELTSAHNTLRGKT